MDGIASCKELEADLGPLPATLQQRTGSGGDQLFFQFPDGVEIPCSVGKVAPGIDIRSAGGYVVVAPSRNEDGAYEWLNRLQPAPLPQAWKERLARKPKPTPEAKPCPRITATLSTPYGKTALVEECRAIADAPAGQRHDQLFKSVAALGGLISGGEVVEQEARAAIMEAVESWNTGAESEDKTLDTIEDALAKGMTEPRQAPQDSLQSYENHSGRSGRSGQPTNDGGFIDPTSENDNSGRSGQPTDNAILPEGYAINAKGLWHVAKSDGSEEPEKTWLGEALHFLARTRNSESEAWGLYLGWHDLDNVPHWWAMPASLLYDTKQSWLSTLLHGGWRGGIGSRAKGLLAQLLATVTVHSRARCVDCTGWHGPAFVLPDAVYGQGEERLVLQSSLAVNPFRQARTLEEWNATMGAWARGNRLLMFAISAALSGPLLDLAGMDSGGFHLHGKSSSGKTTLIRAAWSVWGVRSGVRTWRATSNALESISALHNDALLCLDEIGQAPGKVVGEAAYLIANGQGKSRSQVDGSARALKSWRIPILSNGEMTLADKMREDGQQIRAGQEVRIIDLSADAGAGLGSWQELHGHETPGQFSDAINAASHVNYGTLGRAFLDALTRRRGELSLPQEINAVQCAWSPKDATGQVRRVVQRFALTGLAGELAVAFGLVPWAEGESLAAAKGCLESWLESRGNTGDQEDRRAAETVRAFIARFGSSRFQSIDPGAEDRILDRAGFRRTLNGQAQFLFTSDQFNAVLGGLNATTAAKALDRAGMLHKNDKGLKVRVSLPDLGKVGVYAVNMPDDEGGQSC
ncbi:DUF927 domain-containing protein [Desulfomicrobium sp. ZS1]|nr:DUF927 domain-containing protein [Desulfomicrobium sp. ZS1]